MFSLCVVLRIHIIFVVFLNVDAVPQFYVKLIVILVDIRQILQVCDWGLVRLTFCSLGLSVFRVEFHGWLLLVATVSNAAAWNNVEVKIGIGVTSHVLLNFTSFLDEICNQPCLSDAVFAYDCNLQFE